MRTRRGAGLIRHAPAHTSTHRPATEEHEWASEHSGKGEYADVNGVHLYFETHGEGRPLVLLHGGLGSGEMFGPVTDVFAADHVDSFKETK